MMAYVRERDCKNTASFSFLYLANVLGAMSGTLLTAVVLVELLGFSPHALGGGRRQFHHRRHRRMAGLEATRFCRPKALPQAEPSTGSGNPPLPANARSRLI